MTTEAVLKRCQEAYKRSGMTLDALADKAGLARTTVNSYINSPPKKLRDTTVKYLAAALGIDASQLPETDEPENATEAFMLDHCASCRAETRRHNEALREDFNARHESLRNYYAEHEKQAVDLHVHRYNDLVEHTKTVSELIEKHHADKIKEKDDTIAALSEHNCRLQRRIRIMLTALIVLSVAVTVLSIIDLVRGDVGWLRYAVRNASNHNIWQDITQFLAGWMA